MPFQLIRHWLLPLLAGLSLSLSLTAQPAQAAFAVCRGDPLFWLSDGTFWRASIVIAADPAQVRQVAYDIHVPAGITLVRVLYTGGALQGKELVRVSADAPPGTYRTDTTVQFWTDTTAEILSAVEGGRLALAGGDQTAVVVSVTRLH